MPAHVEVDPDLLAEAIARLRTEYATVEETWRACSASMSETSGGWVGNSCEASANFLNYVAQEDKKVLSSIDELAGKIEKTMHTLLTVDDNNVRNLQAAVPSNSHESQPSNSSLKW